MLAEAALLVAVATVGALGVQRLRDQRHQHQLTERAARLRSVAEHTGPMLACRDTRQAVCEAARSVAQADIAYLVEQDGDGLLVARGVAEHRLPPTITIEIGEQPCARLRAATGAASLLVQPVPCEGRPPVLLAVGWRREGAAGSAVLEALELLAREAGVALQRADLLDSLEAEARHDPLTGAANRRAWDERLAAELERARRAGTPLSVALLDLDHFKAYNDTYGHSAGDRFLVHVTEVWQAGLRAGDLLARWGGEEFALLLPDCIACDAAVLVERVRSAAVVGPTCSAGVAQWDGAEPAGDLVRRADLALYEAKRAGRDCVRSARELSPTGAGPAVTLPCP